jgi:hypothetical protein
MIFTEEHRKKISNALKGRIFSPEHRIYGKKNNTRKQLEDFLTT